MYAFIISRERASERPVVYFYIHEYAILGVKQIAWFWDLATVRHCTHRHPARHQTRTTNRAVELEAREWGKRMCI